MKYLKKLFVACPLLVCLLVSWVVVAGVKYLPELYAKVHPDAQEEALTDTSAEDQTDSTDAAEAAADSTDQETSGDSSDEAAAQADGTDAASGAAVGADATENTSGEKQKKIKPQYITYEKKQTDSPWYTDPGKIPLTTEYDYQKVKKDYFDDAVFIGDSRIVGMHDYSGLDNAQFFAKTGLTIYNLLDDEFVEDPDTGKNVSISYMLQHYTYGKIYMMVGINELGTGGTDYFKQAYKKVLHKMRKWQPDAIIYVQSIMGVSPQKDRTDEVFNNTNIRDKNCAIADLTDGIHIFYLNIQEVYEDENHALSQELTFDDVHLYATHYDKWVKYLKNHAVVKGDAS